MSEQAKEGEESWKDSDFLTFDNGTDEDGEEGDDDDDKNGSKDSLAAPNKRKRARLDEPEPNWQRNNQNNFRNYRKNISLTSVSELPPWMDRPHHHKFHRNVPRLVLLHDEIVSFAKLMAPQPDELKVRQDLVDKVTKLVNDTFMNDAAGEDNHDSSTGTTPKMTVQVFGSQATGLLLPTSDIDFVINLPGGDKKDEKDEDDKDDAAKNNYGDENNGEKKKSKKQKKKKQKQKQKNAKEKDDDEEENERQSKLAQKQQEQKEMEEYSIHTEVSLSPLARLGEALRNHPDWKDQLSYLEVVENTRVPIVKFIHAPTKLSVDICFNQEAGPMAADLMKRFLDAMPPLKPLTFVLKYFMAARGLNEPYSGGCGSFMLQMMIVSFLQHRERLAYKSRSQNTMNLGSMLLEFFELYGLDFNYMTTGISVRSDGFYFPKGAKGKKDHFYQPSRPFSLALENPFDITADVGKASFRMQLVQKSFETAMRVLLSHTSEPYVETESILAAILPPTEEMYKRSTMLKVLKIEEQLIRNSSQNGSKKRKLSESDYSGMDTSSSTQSCD